MLDDTTQAGGNQTNRWRGTLEKLAGEHEASVGAKRNGVHQVRGEGSEVDGTQMSQEDEAVGLTYSHTQLPTENANLSAQLTPRSLC